jgi:glycosyltransferase involved in cell wall biosynthesis
MGRIGSALARPVMAAMARWDRATAGRVHRYVTNSQHVARRIGRYYNREASVVHPPVDTAFFTPDGSSPDRYFLIVSALVPYKRLEVAIEAAARVGVPLRVAGRGPEEPRLRRVAAEAGGEVEFLGRRSDEELRVLYRGARAVLFPGEEDFGIVPVEAQACGRPVVALGRGGALETIIDGVTGVLVPESSVEAFASGLDRVGAEGAFDPAAARAHAERFGRDRFLRDMAAEVAALP